MKIQSRTLKNIFGCIVLVLLIIMGSLYITKNKNAFMELFSLTFLPSARPYLVLSATLSLISVYFNGIIMDRLCYSFGLRLKFMESFSLLIVTRFYNNILPFHGGLFVRAMYLKKLHKFPYNKFIATVTASYMIIFPITSLVALLSILAWYSKTGTVEPIIVTGLFCIFLVPVILIFSFKQIVKYKKSLLSRYKILSGWQEIRRDTMTLFTTAIIAVLQVFIIAFQQISLYRIFGIEISIWQAIIISSLNNLSIIISLTPGNLGISEAVNIYTATILGIDIKEALAVAILSRTLSLIIIFILGPIFTYYLMKRMTILRK